MAISVQSANTGGTLRVAVSGAMNEDTRNLPPLGGSGFERLVLDLNGLKSMNSVGIRLWKEWLSAAPATKPLILQNVHRGIVAQINAVLGFLPPQAKVESIYVPFFCDDCDVEEEHLFETAALGKQAPVARLKGCKKAACQPEADVVWDRYIAFMKSK